jgi:hypothetical protein
MTNFARWRPVAMTVIVPLMLASAVLNQQVSGDLLLWGQIVSTGAVLAAVVITLGTFPDAMWPRALAGLTVALRLVRLGLPLDSIVLAYTASVSALFCAAGAITLVSRPRLIYRQLVVLCVVSVPVMFLQASGIGGDATQQLRTDLHGQERIETVPALFVPENEITPTTLQARPAGLFSSNNLLSFVMLFVLAAHVARARLASLTWRDLAVVTVVVFAMAKILFLALLVLLTYLLTQGAIRRRKALNLLLLTAAVLGLYAYLLPAFFIYNTGADLFVRNLQFRLIDLALSTGIPTLVDRALDAPADIVALVSDPSHGHESGYAGIIALVPLVLVAAAAVLPLFLRGWRYIAQSRPAWRDMVILHLLVLVLVPLITSFLESVFLWFMAGAALLPLLVVAEPGFKRLFDQSDHFGVTAA